MVQQSKLSGVSGTVSGRNVFFRARLKLTGVYILIVAAITIGFSLFLYFNLQQSLNEGNGVDGDFSSDEAQLKFINHTLNSFERDLVLVDAVILVCTGALGFWFAGYTLRPIQRALEAQQSFSENASHELRTPLAVMRSDAEILLRRPVIDKESVRRTLESNIEEIDRLAELAGSLLAVARSGAIEKETKTKIYAAAIVRKAGEKMKGLAESRDINFGLEIKAGDFPAPILCREAEIERVIFNLIQNSLDHTAAGGMITLKAEKDGRAVKISVADTGSGIAKKDLPYVFDRFYKSAGSRGAGLGLSIVRQIAVEHGGTASVNSEPGAGTTVAIKIPLSSN